MKAIKLIIFFLIIFNGAFAMQITSEDSSFMTDILPDTLNGWRSEGSDQIYTAENLYEFINGGAELYLSYGFKKLYHRTYVRKDYPDILVDVFDMGSAANAFGVFMHTREKVEAAFGQGSEYVQGFLNFWKDRFYISILTMAETPQSKAALFKLAAQIDAQIPQKGEIPDLVRKLPQEGLKPASVRYFHHYIWLNSYLYLSHDNILNISEKERIALGKYSDGSTLVIIQYENIEKAKNSYQTLGQKYFPEMKKNDVFKVRNIFLTFNLHPPYLIIAANDQSADGLKKLVQKTIAQLK
ncbi:DUF6599 family protein [Caldithrix abyssi]|uniref:Uncharacterized protein n=2 Tax=Caldithrix abyssi DSM 13497 TaxID=880073 RepID=A0A1J1CG30_CALAY|nr:DUF6599 family protein [Caldithrix abyssi]APF20920.1 hypothetical protein Cabys_4175 [Caldithrix abyssi DSM 13497]